MLVIADVVGIAYIGTVLVFALGLAPHVCASQLHRSRYVPVVIGLGVLVAPLAWAYVLACLVRDLIGSEQSSRVSIKCLYIVVSCAGAVLLLAPYLAVGAMSIHWPATVVAKIQAVLWLWVPVNILLARISSVIPQGLYRTLLLLVGAAAFWDGQMLVNAIETFRFSDYETIRTEIRSDAGIARNVGTSRDIECVKWCVPKKLDGCQVGGYIFRITGEKDTYHYSIAYNTSNGRLSKVVTPIGKSGEAKEESP